MQSDPSDIIGVVGAGLAVIFGQTIANLVGPYIAIVILAIAGSALALSEVEDEWGWFKACRYMVVRTIVAVALTVFLAETVNHFAPWLSPRVSLIPIAFCIGWVRDYERLLKIKAFVLNLLPKKP